MKTRAAIVETKWAPLRLEDVELADPGPRQVRIKIEACPFDCMTHRRGFTAATVA